MADHSDIRYQAGEAAGQAQVKKDELMNKARETAESCKQSCVETTEQAGGMLQQTGEQLMNKAHDAADSVKNAVGMGNCDTTNCDTKRS